ncbi:MAG: response regulator transcription factor [Myxococcales bacterium]|nr:response regulator transcription factor [Myxococcales bacterium]MCB9755298.1 response regulator transcription factor [Myxococcales bacterium]
MTDSMDPQLSPSSPSSHSTGWSPALSTPRPADVTLRVRPTITPALADLVHGYRKPAFMTDVNGQIVCMNAAAGRLFDKGGDLNTSVRNAQGPVTLENWERKATLQADGKTLFLVIPDTPDDSNTRPSLSPQLPPRLAKIARLVVSGCTDKQIASRTGLSFSTVRTYVRQIYRRMGVHSRVELVHATNQGQTLAMD